jgi:hypothetical protein
VWRRRRLDGEPPEIYRGLRTQLLELEPASIGLEPSAELPNVWAGMMEMDVDGDTATIVAVGEGSTSMYLSTGGGVIGGGMHERVLQANHHFLVALENNLDALAPEDEPTLPARDSIIFRALTYGGRRASQATEREIDSGHHALFSLYAAGHDVITALRETEAGGA